MCSSPSEQHFVAAAKGGRDPTGEKLKLRAVFVDAKIELLKWTERKFRMRKKNEEEEEKKKRKKGKKWQARTGQDKPAMREILM